METQTEIDLRDQARQDAQSCNSDIRDLFETTYFEIYKNEYQDSKLQSIKLLQFVNFIEEACQEINLISFDPQKMQKLQGAIKKLLASQKEIDKRALKFNQILIQNKKNHQQEEDSDSYFKDLSVTQNQTNTAQDILGQMLKECEDVNLEDEGMKNVAHQVSQFLKYARETVKKENSSWRFFKKTKIELQADFLKNLKSFQKHAKEDQENITQYFNLHFEQENDIGLDFNIDFYLNTKEAFKFKKKEQVKLEAVRRKNEPLEIKLITKEEQRQKEKSFEPLEIKIITKKEDQTDNQYRCEKSSIKIFTALNQAQP